MKYLIIIFFLINFQYLFSQKNKVYIEKDSIDLNNKTYRIGNVYIFDYEIIENGIKYKLDSNFNDYRGYKFVLKNKESIGIDKIHLIITDQLSSRKTNENQTQIYYFQSPIFSCEATGVVDNDSNIWIHPIRTGFWGCLQASPYPYIEKPIIIGREWNWGMRVVETICDKKWGEWKDWLDLNYHYKITDKKILNTSLGDIDCFITESFAETEIGQTRLKSFFSEKFGFIRLEYTFFTGLKINFWLIDFKENQVFKDYKEFDETKSYKK